MTKIVVNQFSRTDTTLSRLSKLFIENYEVAWIFGWNSKTP